MIQIPPHNPAPSDNLPESVEELLDDVSFDVEEYETEAPPAPPPAELIADSEAFFAPGGLLMRAAAAENRRSEFRPQQLTMARAIAEALCAGRHLAVEAPTGVGKSFAYLIPLIYRAARRPGLPPVVSTETIHLQEQLVQRDLPRLRELTGIPFKAALAKGRNHFLCLRRLALLAGEKSGMMLPAASLSAELEKIADWAERSLSGERDDLSFRPDPLLWQQVCCESGNCPGGACKDFRRCFYFKARQTWDEADIVVANHALFFTDLAMRNEGAPGALLPNYGTVVIDEAHSLEDNAAEHLGLHLSRAALFATLNRLYNPDNARGLLIKPGAEELALRQTIAATREEAVIFYRQFEDFLHESSESGDGSARRVRSTERFHDNLSAHLKVLHRLLFDYLNAQEEADFRTELESKFTRIGDFIEGLDVFMGMKLDKTVYYVEYERGGAALKGAPLNVAELLNRLLFHQNFPVILSSATLSVRGSFDFFCRRVGFDEGNTLLLDSPFSRDQAVIRVSRTIPEPTDEAYLPALAKELPGCLDATGGKAFVLFTSYGHLRYCVNELRAFCGARGYRLLAQGEEMTRSQLLQAFRDDVDSVLFGTDSFWTGVDVPGAALSHVILTKLPFPSPGNPLVEGRCEQIRAEGGNPFRDYSLPVALLRFRQGAGRLIRRRDDRGVITILDRRVLSKSYGRNFLEALPYPVEFPS